MKVDPLIGPPVTEVFGVECDYHMKNRISTLL